MYIRPSVEAPRRELTYLLLAETTPLTAQNIDDRSSFDTHHSYRAMSYRENRTNLGVTHICCPYLHTTVHLRQKQITSRGPDKWSVKWDDVQAFKGTYHAIWLTKPCG